VNGSADRTASAFSHPWPPSKLGGSDPDRCPDCGRPTYRRALRWDGSRWRRPEVADLCCSHCGHAWIPSPVLEACPQPLTAAALTPPDDVAAAPVGDAQNAVGETVAAVDDHAQGVADLRRDQVLLISERRCSECGGPLTDPQRSPGGWAHCPRCRRGWRLESGADGRPAPACRRWPGAAQLSEAGDVAAAVTHPIGSSRWVEEAHDG
jgi:hypothetical protein